MFKTPTAMFVLLLFFFTQGAIIVITGIQAEKPVCVDEARPYDFVQIAVASEEREEVFADGKAV